MKAKTGVLLINLGTPAAPTEESVRTFLNLFLSDEKVLDWPAPLRRLLLKGVILPFRPKRSAKAYEAIWDRERGSPLLFHTQALANGLQAVLGERYHLKIGMRYGQPSLEDGLEHLKKYCDTLLLFPLYPQDAEASRGSAIVAAQRWLSVQGSCFRHVQVAPPFFDASFYISAWATQIQAEIVVHRPEQLVLSYHSLPLRQIKKRGVLCCGRGKAQACPPSPQYLQCYRAQCYATSRLLFEHLPFKGAQCRVAFQSRIGKMGWMGPDLLSVLRHSRLEGIKRILVACPGFVTDCLETLEEVAIRAKEVWHVLGGEELVLVPCLNAAPLWVERLARHIERLCSKP